MDFGGSRTGANSSVTGVRDSGTGAQSEIGNNSGLNLEGRVGSGTVADSKTESKVWRTGADSEPVAVKAGCLGMASVSSMDETMTADCLRVSSLAITGRTSSLGMISVGMLRLAGLDSVGMTRLAKTSSVGTQTEVGPGADSVGSRTGAGSLTGAGSVGSRTGAGSGADSVGSWTGAPSGADSVGSRTGVASRTDSVGSRTGAASGAAELPSGAAEKMVDCKTQTFFLLCLRGCSGMNTGL